MKEILGKKLGMTRIFRDTGDSVPVTVIEVGPCPVVARRKAETHGYTAYQVGFEKCSPKRVNKPVMGQFAKAGIEPMRYIREIHCDGEFEVGSSLRVDLFKEGERVDVSGITRGLGFAGGMKRHNFSGANKTHGQSDRWRAPGSIGCSSYPSRVLPGKRMAGRMGKDKVTVMNLEVVKIIDGENLMLVRGPVPGFKGGLLKIRSTNRG